MEEMEKMTLNSVISPVTLKEWGYKIKCPQSI